MERPNHIDIRKDQGMTVTWPDGTVSTYPIVHLRRWSPSAEARQMREELAKNPLAVLPASSADAGPLRIEDAKFVGNYAIQLFFSDGHSTGIYSWEYLREIDPQRPAPRDADARLPHERGGGAGR